jgi:hypothetical protein
LLPLISRDDGNEGGGIFSFELQQQQQHDRSAAAQLGLLAVYLKFPTEGSLHHSTTTATEYQKKKEKCFIEIHM